MGSVKSFLWRRFCTFLFLIRSAPDYAWNTPPIMRMPAPDYAETPRLTPPIMRKTAPDYAEIKTKALIFLKVNLKRPPPIMRKRAYSRILDNV